MTPRVQEAILRRMRAPWRTARKLGQLLPVAVCALGAHVAVYRSLFPSTGTHAYLAWYEPLVAGLSVASLVTFAALLLAAVLGRSSLRRAVTRVLAPASGRTAPTPVRAARLALASIAFLVCQETLERSLTEGRFAVAGFAPPDILLVLALVAVLAGLVALVERSCSHLVAFVARRSPRLAVGGLPVSVPAARLLAARRRHPLAERRGLRAPPLPV